MNRVVKLSVMASACAFFVLMPVSAAHAEEILVSSDNYLSGSGNDILLVDNNVDYTGFVLTGNGTGGTNDILICDQLSPQNDTFIGSDPHRNDPAVYSDDILVGTVLNEAGSGNGDSADILSVYPDADGTSEEAVILFDTSERKKNPTADTGRILVNAGDTKSEDSISAAERALKAINSRRTQAGYRAVKLNSKLNRVAEARVREIATRFSHIRPNGRNSVSILSEYGVDYNMAGENIARNVSSPERVVAGWASSPTHNRCMMSSDYTQAGIGTATIGGCTYWVLILTD